MLQMTPVDGRDMLHDEIHNVFDKFPPNLLVCIRQYRSVFEDDLDGAG